MIVVYFLGVLTVLILLHELGHFFTAKFMGVPVRELGIGFPPRVGAVRWGDTEYSLNWLPLGGFVRLAGEDDPTVPGGFASRPRWQRAIIIGSGPMVNLVLPIIIFTFVFLMPSQKIVGDVIIQEVAPNSPAMSSGLEAGDRIAAINNEEIETASDVTFLVMKNVGSTLDVRIERDGNLILASVDSRLNPPEGEGATGIRIGLENAELIEVRYPVWKAPLLGLERMRDLLLLLKVEFSRWTAGGSGPQLAGPIGIARMTGEVAEAGFGPLLEFAALLSLNLGIMNFLPIPMLDGGRLFFILVETLRGGRRISPQRESLVHFIGLMFIMSLLVVVTYQDIVRLISGEGAIP